MKNVLLVTDYYLPGYKAGGPIRSLSNLVDWLGDEITFWIVTSDRDLGDFQRYPALASGTWLPLGKAHVLYLAPHQTALLPLRSLLSHIDYDLVYLNSFFSAHTRRMLLLRKSRMLPDRPVVLAPRGEFSPGALSIKRFRKELYISCSRHFGLYDNIVWQATTDLERQDILSAVGASIKNPDLQLKIAPNLASNSHPPHLPKARMENRHNGIRVAFLSRISRKKNLNYALSLFHGIQGDVEFDIYGPIEDTVFWNECLEIISKLPANIRTSYKGNVHPEQVIQTLASYNLFLLPTRGENFGHAILEALTAGCPVLISDQTPWRELQSRGIGWDLPLTDPDGFRSVISRCIQMDVHEFGGWSMRANQFACEFARQQGCSALNAYRALFLSIH